MNMEFKRATKYGAKAKVALCGPAGSGKTYSALAMATRLAQGGKVAVIDTEHGSASKYADLFTFDTLQLDSFAPSTYVKALKAAEDAGFSAIVIDSLSHAWMGKDGALEQVDNAKARSGGGNSFTAWKDVTPQHNSMVEAMLACKAHLVVTMRSKMEYVLETNEKGKQVPRKVGMAPIQRDGLEYEFDLVGDMDIDNNLVVSKSRCPDLSGKVIRKPDEEPSTTLLAWLEGAPEPKSPPAPAAAGDPPDPKLQLLLNAAKDKIGREPLRAWLLKNYPAFDGKKGAPLYGLSEEGATALCDSLRELTEAKK